METNLIVQNLTDIFLKHDISFDREENSVIVQNILVNSENIELFRNLNTQAIATDYEIDGQKNDDFEAMIIGNLINIYLDLTFLRTKVNYNFYHTVDDFLRANRVKINIENFFINEIKSTHQLKEDSFFEYYNSISILQEIIKNISIDEPENVENSDLKYTIFDKKKLVIISKYNYNDIKKLSESIDFFTLISSLHDETLKDSDKRTNVLFLINALETVFANLKEIDFSNILEKLQDIYEEYQIHHRAYINSLEPGKLKEAFEKDIQDSIGKLNNLLSDVNSKMIFLPIAFIVSLGQLGVNQNAKNLIIFMGMFIFCLLVHKFSKTQQELLEVINQDIQDKQKTFSKNVSKFSKELEPKINRLLNLVNSIEKRFNWTINLTWSILFIVFVALIYYCCSQEILEWFCNLYIEDNK